MKLREYAATIGLDVGCLSEECVWGSLSVPEPWACTCSEDKGTRNEMDDMTLVAESALRELDSVAADNAAKICGLAEESDVRALALTEAQEITADLRREIQTLRCDVNVLEGMLHAEQEAHVKILAAYRERREQHLAAQEVIEVLRQEIRRLKGEDKCQHCGGPSRNDYCDDSCEECHESNDWSGGYDPRVEDCLTICESNICGKSRVL